MMTDRSKRYEEAAEAYAEIVKIPFESEIREITDFYRNEDWDSILKMLTRSRKAIGIGYLKGAHNDIGYFLCGDGFCTKYIKDHKEIHTLITDEPPVFAPILAEAFRNQFPKGSFKDFVYGELDSIADAVKKNN